MKRPAFLLALVLSSLATEAEAEAEPPDTDAAVRAYGDAVEGRYGGVTVVITGRS